MILILSDKFDAHADLVCFELDRVGAKYYRINLDVESLKTTYVTWSGYEFQFEINDEVLLSSLVRTVWVRRAFVELSLEESTLDGTGLKIWKGEWDRLLIGLYNSLSSAIWLNKLDKAYKADNKFLQYVLARDIGFTLAPIITSNTRQRLVDFHSQYDAVVIKMMNQNFYLDSDGTNKGMYVNKVSTEDMMEFGYFNENPITLQKYIPKSYEVRYTVIGDEHHVCRIDSQKSTIANVDWRRYDLANTPHSLIDPPVNIKNMVVFLMRELDLKYGALDFIVSDDGDWIFLEINSMGQWLWIESLTGAKISKSISNWLINNC